jgi:PAS domain S-box-containing protein
MYLLLDKSGFIVHVNLAGCRMLGADRAHVIDHPLLTRVVPEDRRAFLEHLRRCRSERGVIQSELRLQRQDGSWLTSRFYSRRSSFNGRELLPTVVTDLSEQLLLEEARVQAILERDKAERERQVAQASAQAKDKLLTMVSHELRTPLTPALIASARLARMDALPSGARELAVAVQRGIEAETHLIDDLLDIERLERGRIELSLTNVDVHEALRYSIETCAPAAEVKRLLLKAEFDATEHHTEGDLFRLRQVFWNLISNAVKFTDVGGRIRVHTTTTQEGLLQVNVHDSGAGMDPETIAGLFSPFEPTGTGGSRRGLGLGLTICKGIIDAHGGRISAKSPGPGRGSTFVVELATSPAPQSASVTPRFHESSSAWRPPGRLRVLLVEDDEETSKMLSMFLSNQGCDVEVAKTMTAGSSRLREGWDVVVSDIGLPDGSGLEVAHRARALTPRPRTIALTGYGSMRHVEESRQAGFDDHLDQRVRPPAWSRPGPRWCPARRPQQQLALQPVRVVHVGRGRVLRADRPAHPLLVPPDLVHAVVVAAGAETATL